MWWRVSVDAKGDVIVCALMEKCVSAAGDSRTYYVQAANRASALAAAHVRYLELQRLSLRDRRLRNVADGLCRCGGVKPKNRKQCHVCAESSATSTARKAARKRGEEVPPKMPKAVAFARTRARREWGVRLDVLRAVQAELSRTCNVAKLMVWLKAAIADAETRAK
jgi:hypothetical protein